jgi:hypothetical protein
MNMKGSISQLHVASTTRLVTVVTTATARGKQQNA